MSPSAELSRASRPQTTLRSVTLPGWLPRLGWPLAGFALAVLAWAWGVGQISATPAIAESFSPQASARALTRLLADGTLWPHIATSLERVGIAMLLALLLGVPLGVLLGLSRRFSQATSTLFHFLRMVSPLSWMPLAVMVLGVGDAPVIFLLSFAAVWPVMLNTAAGVAALDPNWLRLSASLAATRRELVLQVVLPGIVAHLLTGFRLAVGIAWIVLVPAEMLGVSAGLGYFILDARDRLAYSDLMAAIVVIGLLGFTLDALARALHRRWLHQPDDGS